MFTIECQAAHTSQVSLIAVDMVKCWSVGIKIPGSHGSLFARWYQVEIRLSTKYDKL